jgi:predicted double-glycine peptidase
MTYRYLPRAVALIFIFFAAPLQAKDSSQSCADLLFIDLPVVAQATHYTCGVACFDSLLLYWKGWSPGEFSLTPQMGTTAARGTTAEAVLSTARRYGFIAQEQVGATVYDLRRYLGRGETVYVAWDSGGIGHYSLVRGLGRNHITLMDPWYARKHPGEYHTMSFSEFIPVWDDGVRWRGRIIRISPRPLL